MPTLGSPAEGRPAWVWLAVALGAIVIAGGAVVLVRRRHTSSSRVPRGPQGAL